MGIPVRSAHDFRRTYATWMVVSRVDAATVRDLLGHTDLSMTSKYVDKVKPWEIRDWAPAVLMLGEHRRPWHNPADTRLATARDKALRRARKALTTSFDRGATEEEKLAALEFVRKTADEHGITGDDLLNAAM